ncbi:MAG: DedA family protein [Minisyncoccia bacterium]
MSFAHSLQLLIEYRYWILIPLSLIEGPIIAFVAGTLSSLGYFDLYILAAVFFARDMLMDSIYYAIGYFGAGTHFAKRMLARIRVTEQHLEDVRILWEKYPFRTMFIGKISYGIASSFIVVAGMVRMRLRIFFTYGALVAVLQYWTLLGIGYFYGNAFGGTIASILRDLEIVLAGAMAIIAAYYIFSARIRSKFLERIEP